MDSGICLGQNSESSEYQIGMLALMHLRSDTTLGIYVAYADQFDNFEVVPVCSIEAPLALIPVQLARQNQALTIAISFDHVRKWNI
jgi:hypothetical protein